MEQIIKEQLKQLWIARPGYIKESQKSAQDNEKIGSFMVIPYSDNELYISMLVEDEVYEASVATNVDVDFIRGDIVRKRGEDVFQEESIVILDNYDLKFKLYDEGRHINDIEVDKDRAIKSISNILLAMLEK